MTKINGFTKKNLNCINIGVSADRDDLKDNASKILKLIEYKYNVKIGLTFIEELLRKFGNFKDTIKVNPLVDSNSYLEFSTVDLDDTIYTLCYYPGDGIDKYNRFVLFFDENLIYDCYVMFKKPLEIKDNLKKEYDFTKVYK